MEFIYQPNNCQLACCFASHLNKVNKDITKFQYIKNSRVLQKKFSHVHKLSSFQDTRHLKYLHFRQVRTSKNEEKNYKNLEV